MSVADKSGSALPFAGFLILTALGAFIWHGAPLESSRPVGDENGYGTSAVGVAPARLWQDPFKAVYKHLNSRFNAPGLAERHHEVSDKIKSIAREGNIIILTVMLPGGSYAEVEERRRRKRYAVLSALGISGFEPKLNSSIEYFSLQKPSELVPINRYFQAVPYEWYTADSLRPLLSNVNNLLVLWLDESEYAAAPYENLYWLVTGLLGDNANNFSINQNIKMFVIGPTHSGVLKTMVDKAEVGNAYIDTIRKMQLQGFHIFSPTATVADIDLYINKENWDIPTTSTRLHHLLSLKDCDNDQNPKQTCMSFHRTIRSDDVLIKALIEELKTRQITFGKDHVALVSEWDTYFGRALPVTFSNNIDTAVDPSEWPVKRIHRFSYLRGIDGNLPKEINVKGETTASTKNKNGGKSKSSSNGLQDEESNIRRPVGTGQFDYLRRLSDEIKRRDEALRAEFGRGIKAIGILGSDVYDKLLILRALRRDFPTTVFFTTDLDTEVLHPKEYKWARNLIIASSFDLQLHPYLQHQIPPFRDSYQTSIFFSTLLAIKTDFPFYYSAKDIDLPLLEQNHIYQWIPPMIFEVGRNGAVKLDLQLNEDVHTPTASPVLKEFEKEIFAQVADTGDVVDFVEADEKHSAALTMIHAYSNKQFYWHYAFGICCLILIGIIALHQMRTNSGVYVLLLCCVVVIFGVVVYIAIDSSRFGEPISFTNGLSVWPGVFLRLIAISFAMYFSAKLIVELHKNIVYLSNSYAFNHFDSDSDIAVEPTVLELISDFNNLPRRLCKCEPWMIVTASFMIAALLLMIYLRDVFSVESIYWIPPVWILFVALWYLYIFKVEKVKSINEWSHKILKKGQIKVKECWLEYCELGDVKNRVLRTFATVLLYMAFISVVYALFGMPFVPCRGEASCNTASLAYELSLFTTIFLILLVTDATRLCIYWIRALRTKELLWPPETIEKFEQAYNIDHHYAGNWLKVQLIAERTQEVGQLIYYPIIVILLLLVARVSFFDNWGFPQATAIVFCLNLLIVITAALMLRKEAERTRQQALENIQDNIIKLSGYKNQTVSQLNKDAKESLLKQLEHLIEDINSIQTGAFRPVLDQPIVKAMLILAGGIGLSVSEYRAFLY